MMGLVESSGAMGSSGLRRFLMGERRCKCTTLRLGYGWLWRREDSDVALLGIPSSF
jgi:hypothetical protein